MCYVSDKPWIHWSFALISAIPLAFWSHVLHHVQCAICLYLTITRDSDRQTVPLKQLSHQLASCLPSTSLPPLFNETV